MRFLDWRTSTTLPVHVSVNPRINGLLADLPSAEYDKLADHLELVSLPKGQDLFFVDEVPVHVHYPVGGIVSMMRDMPDGYSVETYMLGNNSAVGLSAMLGLPYFRANVRHSGLAYRIPMHKLQQLLPECPEHAAAISKNLVRMVMQMSQSVVCSKRHTVEQQLVRWMLVSLDRMLAPVIESTHQEISERLGFRREAITLALGKLTAMGFIHSRRGMIEVTHREGLEALACDCYWIAQGKKARPEASRSIKPSPVLSFED